MTPVKKEGDAGSSKLGDADADAGPPCGAQAEPVPPVPDAAAAAAAAEKAAAQLAQAAQEALAIQEASRKAAAAQARQCDTSSKPGRPVGSF